MIKFKLPNNVLISLLVSGILFMLAAFSDISFPLLSLERDKVANGEIWRILTSNFVHFGWPHTLMNLAAFLIAGLILLDGISANRFISLLFVCCFSVGLGIYYLNPEYGVYAGLSGSIHGLIIAGLLLNTRHANWVNGVFIALIFGKIFYEHQSNYRATDLQNLLPVPVAYDAHLYGAIAGLAFGVCILLFDKFTYKINRSQ